MKKNIQIIMMFAVFGVFLTCASASFGQMVGGYKSASTSDDGVVAAAEFAVSDYTEKNSVSLDIVNIQKAERQVVQGTNYRICIEVKASEEGNNDTQFVQIVVYQDLKGNYKLSSWKTNACGS